MKVHARGGRSFHSPMWMIPTFRLNNLTCKIVPSNLSQPCTSRLYFSWYTRRSFRLIAAVTACHRSLPTHYSWLRTYLPLQPLFCPREPKSRVLLPSSERNRLGYGCEVRTWLKVSLLLADTIRLRSRITGASQAWTESHRARRSWTLHRPSGILERAVSTSTGRMRQTPHYQHEARTVEPSAFGSIWHNPRLRYNRAWFKT